MNYSIRPIEAGDISFLWDMLYESLYVPEGQVPFSKEIIHDPFISKYVEGWGRDGDFGFIAIHEEGKPVGSITARYFNESNKGFGFVDHDVPELGMAILEDYRGIGIGSALLNELFKEARMKNIGRISLSVDPNNEAAMRLYQRFCFEEVGKVDTSITMVANVNII
ncbi:GNAT family N-acetyltransferase [Paenibacillus sp. 453mf]|uniref:GNAT family N-acetyltransferase n=1 Tax=Paenibacillus sp. 453mf TaxID=1761874 RepID=UPI0008E13A6A|nr:GNAT family N-acetyltransferase [Paenibacillus sp. 453mf]SFS41174.1 L-amino acid N-acyltransferase YncA [Paenibacillus sp. 453mf]